MSNSAPALDDPAFNSAVVGLEPPPYAPPEERKAFDLEDVPAPEVTPDEALDATSRRHLPLPDPRVSKHISGGGWWSLKNE